MAKRKEIFGNSSSVLFSNFIQRPFHFPSKCLTLFQTHGHTVYLMPLNLDSGAVLVSASKVLEACVEGAAIAVRGVNKYDLAVLKVFEECQPYVRLVTVRRYSSQE